MSEGQEQVQTGQQVQQQTGTQTVQQQTIAMDREQIAPWEFDTHKLLSDANLGRQMRSEGWPDVVKEIGLPASEFRALWNAARGDPVQQQQIERAAAEQGVAIQGAPKAEDIGKLIEEKLTAQFDAREKRMTESQSAERQKFQIQSARKSEDSFAFDTLKAANITPPESGKTSPMFTSALSSWDRALARARSESIPEFWSDDDRKAYFDRPASKAELDKAKQLFEADWKDLQNEFVASYAKKQPGSPAASLAGGPAGRQGQKQWNEMSVQERIAATTGHVKRET